MPRAREYNHSRPLLDVHVCEHDVRLKDVVGVYEGDSFADPACLDSRGKPRNHLATSKKYSVDKGWQLDYDRYQQQLEQARIARNERKST